MHAEIQSIMAYAKLGLVGSSLAGQTLTWGESLVKFHHHLISNMLRISWCVNWVSDKWDKRVPFFACCLESDPFYVQ